MWHMIICDGNEPDGMAKQKPPDIVIVAQDSVEGLNTIGSARMLSGKIIWFSDLYVGVHSY